MLKVFNMEAGQSGNHWRGIEWRHQVQSEVTYHRGPVGFHFAEDIDASGEEVVDAYGAGACRCRKRHQIWLWAICQSTHALHSTTLLQPTASVPARERQEQAWSAEMLR